MAERLGGNDEQSKIKKGLNSAVDRLRLELRLAGTIMKETLMHPTKTSQITYNSETGEITVKTKTPKK